MQDEAGNDDPQQSEHREIVQKSAKADLYRLSHDLLPSQLMIRHITRVCGTDNLRQIPPASIPEVLT